MMTTIKIRLEPNNIQKSKLFQSAGTARWAYNWTLAKQRENYKSGGKFISDNDLRKELTQLKKTDELKWLNSISNNIPKQAIKDACGAFIKFFKGKSGFPKFKKRNKSTLSFYNDVAKLKVTMTHVKIEKVGYIKLSESSRIPIGDRITGMYSNPRITYDGLNWYISVGIDIKNPIVKLTKESIGIDVGIKDLAICSNIEKPFKNINKTEKVKILNKKLCRLQRKVSKKYKKNKEGEKFRKTSNIIKLEKKIKKVYKKLNNIKTDYRHKVATEIVKTKPSRIVMEDLNIKGMMKNRHLSKAIAQQSLYEFKTMIKYKSNKCGIEFIEANRWYPSSKTCSHCGHIKSKLSLSERIFICEKCGTEIDRDKNASINLSRYKAS